MDLAICVRNVAPKQLCDLGRFAEETGFTGVFVPDGATGGRSDSEGRLMGRDAWISLAAMFASTSRVRGTLGVAATPMYHHLILPAQAATLYELSEGRFSLGLGVSHPEQTARFGAPFPDRPVEFMRSWIRDLKARAAGGTTYGGGWDVLVAALGPRMVDLGAQEADGLILNWLTPESAAESVGRVRNASGAGPSPRVVLYVRLMTAEVARADAASYDSLVNYHRNFAAQGLDNPDVIAAGTTLSRDDLGAARARLDEYRAAGLDTVCLYPAAFEADDRKALQALSGSG